LKKLAWIAMLAACCAAILLGDWASAAGTAEAELAALRQTEQAHLEAFVRTLGEKRVTRAEGEALTKDYARDMLRRYEAFRDRQTDRAAALEAGKEVIQIALVMLDDEKKVEEAIGAAKDRGEGARLRVHAAELYAALREPKKAGRLAREAFEATQDPEILFLASRTLFFLNPVGKEFPEFPPNTKDVEGQPLRLSEYRGKVVLIHFWASWCEPCAAEAPELARVYRDYHSKGFEILGVSQDESKEAMEAAARRFGMTWRQQFDGRGRANVVSDYYGVRSIPRMYLIGRDGKVVRRIVGGGQELEKALKKLLD